MSHSRMSKCLGPIPEIVLRIEYIWIRHIDRCLISISIDQVGEDHSFSILGEKQLCLGILNILGELLQKSIE